MRGISPVNQEERYTGGEVDHQGCVVVFVDLCVDTVVHAVNEPT